ncbi:MAG: HDIG domain-containing protein [Magnetococcales bacterium]|nr:HDIG domain-containing protein [Magnetococcales bacterium]
MAANPKGNGLRHQLAGGGQTALDPSEQAQTFNSWATQAFAATERFLRRNRILNPVAFLGLVTLLTLIYSPLILKPPPLPRVGAVAPFDIKADRDILTVDLESTRNRREAAAEAVIPVYDWDDRMLDGVSAHLRANLQWLAQARREQTPKAADVNGDSFSQQLSEPIPPRAFQVLLDLDPASGFAAAGAAKAAPEDKAAPPTTPLPYHALLQSIDQWLDPLHQRRVVSGPEVLKDLQRGSYTLRSLSQGQETLIKGADGLLDLDGMRKELADTSYHHLSGYPRILRQWLVSELGALIRPNFVLNLAETSKRRQKAWEAVEEVYFRAIQGEIVVREGEVVTEAARAKMVALLQGNSQGVTALRTLGLGAVLGLFLWLARWFLLQTSTAFPRDRTTLYILGTILLVVALLSTLTLYVGQGLAGVFHWDRSMVRYLPPVALGSALTSLIVGARTGIPGGSMVVATVLAFLSAQVANGGLPLFLYYLVGSLVGAFALRSCRQRFDVLGAGLQVGFAQLTAFPLVEALLGNFPNWSWTVGAGMAVASGLLCGLLGLALIPTFEWIYNLTTDSRLLELASGDHPLLKKLSLRTPGTYHHSVMMGNLAEAAAESIGANPLMARVMALYHDIGKLNKPHYFIENQSGDNRHDHLSPSMSAKIIMAHVKDGVEMARQFKLGGPILEAITTHQGTSLLQYFYNKAAQEAARRGESIPEDEFRYPGPKPQSKESGILMIADAVEAAARTLKTPSPAKIQALVRRIVTNKIADQQLDECKLTLREITLIQEAFCRVLILGFYHHRIAYPDQIPKPPVPGR